MIIRIGGVRGIGKSTVSDAAIDLLRGLGVSANMIDEPEFVQQILGYSKEELHSLPMPIRRLERMKLLNGIEKLDRINPQRLLLRDAPFAEYLAESENFAPVFSLDREVALFMITAPIDVVLSRRVQNYSTRLDRVINPDFLEREMQAEIVYAQRQAESNGTPLTYINGNLDTPTEIALQIVTNIRNQVWFDLELKPKRMNGETE